MLLATANITGLYYRYMTEGAHRRTFVGTRTCIESRVKLECEKEQQEQLLLSVIPAYIAAEVIDVFRNNSPLFHRNCSFNRIKFAPTPCGVERYRLRSAKSFLIIFSSALLNFPIFDYEYRRHCWVFVNFKSSAPKPRLSNQIFVYAYCVIRGNLIRRIFCI